MHKLDDDYQKLIDGVNKSVEDPEAYKKYLDFYSKFPTRSFRNQMLIYSQREDATFVAGLKAWNKFGRKVNKGSKAIKIIAPRMKTVTEKDQKTGKDIKQKKITGFNHVNVFDVKDTSGVPLPTNPIVPKNVNKSEFAEKIFPHIVEELRKELPISLNENYGDRGNGFYIPLEHRIEINAKSDRDLTNQLKTLLHEYAHSIFHNPSGKYKDSPKETKELQAESVAYMTSKSFGMDTSQFSFPYIKGWASGQSEKMLLESQEDIQKESAALIKRIEEVIIEKKLSFDVAVTIDENITPLTEGQEKISLIKFGDTYCIAKGEYDESQLNNLDSIKKLGFTFDNEELAINTFNVQKGYLPLSDLKQIGKEKGNIHIYERATVDPLNGKEKKMYAIGVKSLANVKMVTNSTPDLNQIKNQYKTVLAKQELSKEQKMYKDLATRDSDRDGLTDLQEKRMGTNPRSSDTDNDGIPDHLDHRPTTADRPRKMELERGL